MASPTYIQNADVIFRHTLDRRWLASEIVSVNLAADFLASLTTSEGIVKGGGYYVERPPRLESDGVTHSHAVDAFRRVAALNRLLDDRKSATRYEHLAQRIQHAFVTRFWVKDHFAEYRHPAHGLIASHGLTDSDGSALAMGVATHWQQAARWPRLKDEKRFYYGRMPTGISTEPATYEAWEFNYRGELDFMHQSLAQVESRNVKVEDGWIYFVHGWTQVVAQVLHFDLTPALFDKLNEAASSVRGK